MARAQLFYDGQSVVAAWVAERLGAWAGAELELVNTQDRLDRAQERELVLRTDDGAEARGLQAVLEALALRQDGVRWREGYRGSRLRRVVYDRGYAWANQNRETALFLAKRLWGEDRRSYAKARWLFLRALALSYFIAFTSLGVQVRGLFGVTGISPAVLQISQMLHRRQPLMPTLFLFGASDGALAFYCGLGAVLSVLVLAGVAQRFLLVVLAFLYLSYVAIGDPFLGFQWDSMLIEAGVLGAFLAPRGRFTPLPRADVPRLPLFVLRWLAARVMFQSGFIKVTTADGAWRDLSALDYHLWTQPLPGPLAPWLAALPRPAMHLTTGLVLAIELLLPLCAFGPRPLRRIAFAGFALMLVGINLAGSYGFLGLLTLAPCFLLLDDADYRWLKFPLGKVPPIRWRRLRATLWTLATVLLLILFGASISVTWARMRRSWEFTGPLGWMYRQTSPFLVANPYGMFESMTKDRLEISLEGSLDGEHWEPYRFRYKPDDPSRPPRYAAPHMPRLDWMMWFAALGDCDDSPWLYRVQARLLQDSKAVKRLFEAVPFDGAPPKYMRAMISRYRFAPPGADPPWLVEPPDQFCRTVVLAGGNKLEYAP